MKSALTKVAVLLVSASLVSCSTNTQKENTIVGAGTGAVVGGLLGSAVGGGTAIGVGIVAGALAGGLIGHSMDSSDSAQMSSAIANGQSSSWKNSKTHTTYTVVTSKHYITVNGNPHCRKYMTKAMVDGKVVKEHGIACREKDGSWKAMQQR